MGFTEGLQFAEADESEQKKRNQASTIGLYIYCLSHLLYLAEQLRVFLVGRRGGEVSPNGKFDPV